jgi:hypothetical protein
MINQIYDLSSTIDDSVLGQKLKAQNQTDF